MQDTWTDGYIADVEYSTGFYREQSPLWLQLCLLSKGREAPDATEPLRYCELGCGHGLTANILAAAYPHVSFDAMDFNPAHITSARKLARAAGLRNIRYHERSFQEFLAEPDLPEYDIISLHGIYSWISPENRAAILGFINRRLRPGGVVYISYNSMPGWASLAPFRRLMQDHAVQTSGQRQIQIQEALAFCDEMRNVKARHFAVLPGIAAKLDLLRRHPQAYVVHEYMCRDWNPFYFNDIADELWRAKLAFAASATLLEHLDQIHFTKDQQAILDRFDNVRSRENLRDYMVNQQFRRDIFVRGGASLSTVRRTQLLYAVPFISIMAAGKRIPHVVTSLGSVGLNPAVFEPVQKRLEEGPVTISALQADPECAGIPADALVNAVTILVGADRAAPCLSGGDEVARRESASSFNKAVFEHQDSIDGLNYLVSPLTGSAVPVDHFGIGFLGAIERGLDPVDHAWRWLVLAKQLLIVDGRVLKTEAENREALAARLQAFRQDRLPVLRRLQVTTVTAQA
jgi:SAM-dependent methyltransferase